MDFSRTGIFDFVNLISIFKYSDKRAQEALRCVNRHFYETCNHGSLLKITEKQEANLTSILSDINAGKTGRHKPLKLDTMIEFLLLAEELIKEGKHVIFTGYSSSLCRFYWEYEKWNKSYKLSEPLILDEEWVSKKKLEKMVLNKPQFILISGKLVTTFFEVDIPNKGQYAEVFKDFIMKNKTYIGYILTDNFRRDDILEMEFANIRFIFIENDIGCRYRYLFPPSIKETDGIKCPKVTCTITMQSPDTIPAYIIKNKQYANVLFYSNNKSKVFDYKTGDDIPISDVMKNTGLKYIQFNANTTCRKKYKVFKEFNELKVPLLGMTFNDVANKSFVYPDTVFIVANQYLEYKIKMFLSLIKKPGSRWSNVHIHVIIVKTGVWRGPGQHCDNIQYLMNAYYWHRFLHEYNKYSITHYTFNGSYSIRNYMIKKFASFNATNENAKTLFDNIPHYSIACQHLYDTYLKNRVVLKIGRFVEYPPGDFTTTFKEQVL